MRLGEQLRPLQGGYSKATLGHCSAVSLAEELFHVRQGRCATLHMVEEWSKSQVGSDHDDGDDSEDQRET